MNPNILSDAVKLSDQELVAQVHILAGREREATAALIAHLAVFDERRLYLAEGSSSLFAYCTQVLHFAEHAAYNRIEAARAARKYPVILEMLADGAVNLAIVRLLAPELTAAHHRELLDSAKHKSKRQIEELMAGLRPLPPVPSTIRKLPAASLDTGNSEAARLGFSDLHSASAPTLEAVAFPDAAFPVRPPVVTPLAPERYKVQFTASAQTHAKLRQAQDLLRHQIPNGDLGEIIDRALTVLLRDLTRQKIAATDQPRPSSTTGMRNPGGRVPAASSRHIPAEVRRSVWARDGGQCAFVAPNGCRCTERGFLEFHHVVPYGAGGGATVDNIELRCRAHNGYEAERYFGKGTIARGRPGTFGRTGSGPS